MVKVTVILVSAWLAVRLPCVAYATFDIVPFQSEKTRSAAGRALKLAVGCPATGDPAELGAGIAKVLVGGPEDNPATPIVGSIVSGA
jgi:hypothetical protein